jgi:pimeloyl-ACP methyl ester carboxylesterase
VKIISTTVLALTLLTGSSCAPDWRDGDEHFYVTHKGSSMPVWVTGNWRSNKIIVHLHGGPGTTNAIYYQKSSYQRLADEFGIVYYEQRASGSALGLDRDHLTVDQFVEDLDVIMTVLEHRYPEAEFLLTGHSWGGHLGSAYLLDPERQARFVGWIEHDGAHDASCTSWIKGRDFVLAHAEEVLAGSPRRKTRRYWEEAKRYYADVWKCDPITNENNQNQIYEGKTNHLHHSLYIREAGGYDVNPDKVLNTGETLELLFESQFDLIGVTAHSPLPVEGYYGVDLTPRLGEITIPSMVLWGEHDIITHFSNAVPAYEALGAAPEHKRLVLFPDSGHNPWAEEPDAFYAAVSEFANEVFTSD